MSPADDRTNPYTAPSAPLGSGASAAGNAGKVATCPACGHADANKISFTWWGGALGPKLMSHVRCTHCRAAYNGKTGKYNTKGIVIYQAVGLVIAALFLFAWHGLRH